MTVYNIDIEKSITFLHTNNEAAESEIMKTTPFTIAPKPTRDIGIYLNREVKNLYSENYKALMGEIEDATNK